MLYTEVQGSTVFLVERTSNAHSIDYLVKSTLSITTSLTFDGMSVD